MNRTKKVLWTIPLLFVITLIVTSCKVKHEHSYAMNYNETNHWQECECGEKNTEQSHSFGSWTTTKVATATTLGIEERECSVCHYKEIKTIPALGHSHIYSTEWTIDVEPTCTTTGSKSHHCLVCDDKADITTIEKKDHTYGEWKTIEEATEEIEGSKERECNVCHHKEIETIPVLPHTHKYSTEWTIDVEPTCTTTGSKSHHCLGCDDKTDITIIEMFEHTYGDWEITKYPTETEVGSKERECSVCNHKETSTISNFLKTTEGIDYTLDSKRDSYTVYRIDATTADVDIVIPLVYNSLPITSIGERAFGNCSSLTSIVIPNSVTSIGEDAFSGCGSLTNVYYEGSVEDWCKIAFYSYESNPMYYASHFYLRNKNYEWEEVTSIVIPNSVTSIGEYAFWNCSSLTSIVIPNSVTSIGEYAFWNCSSLTSIVIPNSVTSIGEGAFAYCDSLTNVYYEGKIEDWCNITFYGFDGSYTNPMIFANHFYIRNSNNEWEEVTSIEIPNTVTKIGKYQFDGFNNVTSITISDSVTSIRESAFYNCSNLNNVFYDGTIEDWCKITFAAGSNLMEYTEHFYLRNSNNEWEEVTSIEIPNTITKIGDYQFYGFNNVTSITMQNSVTSIGEEAFSGCSSLTSITISNNVTSIGYAAFRYCSSLTSIVIPDSVISIGSYAFSGCSSLTSITIPNSVTSIGEEAFSGCSSLTSITIPNSVTSIGDGAFYNCYKLVEVYNLSSLDIIIGSNSNGLIGYYAKVIHTSLEEESNLIIKDDYIFIKDNENKYYLVQYNGIATELVLPNDIEGNTYEINQNAFYKCSSLTSVTIPNSVTSIGEYAFFECSSLTSVTIPESITSIESYAFNRCFGLVEVFNLSSLSIALGSVDNGYIGCNAKVIHTSLEEQSNFITKDDYVFIKDNENKYYLVRYNGTETELVLPNDIEGNTYAINDYAFCDGSSLTSIVIPTSVTSIAEDAFEGCINIEKATIPAVAALALPRYIKEVIIIGGESLGNYAFYGCRSLTSIVIPNSVTSIGQSAFYNCSSLTSIVIPNSVTNIGNGVFERSSSLTNVYYEGTITDWCNGQFTGLTLFKSFNSNHFYLKNSNNEWEEVISIEIPNTITEIGTCQFYGFSNVTSITIPNSVTSIGDSAFSGCSSLTSVTIPFVGASLGEKENTYFGYIFGENLNVPSSLKEVIITGGECIEASAFFNCISLTSIEIPTSVTSIGSSAFYGCNSLESITLPFVGASLGKKENTHFGYIFGASTYSENLSYVPSNLKEVIITGGESIEASAFSYCISLTSITIPNSVISIGSSAFYDCDNLTSITIPESVTGIGEEVFRNCSNLTSITLPFVGSGLNGTSNTHFGYIFGASTHSENSSYVPSSLKKVIITGEESIDWYAFSDCSSLTSIEIPTSVTSIGQGAFSGCSSLTNITIPNSVTSIGQEAFKGCSHLTSIVIPNSVTSIGSSAFYSCSKLESITLPYAPSPFGFLFGTSSYYNNPTYVPESLKKVIITGGNSIEENTFFSCCYLRNIIIPNSVTRIEKRAFFDCGSLTSITIPNSVTSIGEYAFENCGGLTSITIPDSVTSIGKSAFSECSSLTNAIIGDGVTSIGNSVFYNCYNLISVTIPTSVTSIADAAFYECSSLTTVYYRGTSTQWGNIVIDSRNNYLKGATIIFKEN